MTAGIRVGVIDKHPLFRDGVVLALRTQADIEVVGQGASIWDAIDLAEKSQPHVIVVDAGTLDCSMGAVESILQQHPSIRILILADEASEDHIRAALKRGVRGYLLKGSSAGELAETVRALSLGQCFISPSLAAKLLMRTGPEATSEATGSGHLSHLTPREQQILSILAQGRSNKEIGSKLELSEKTIKHHLTNILQKLHVRNRVEAALVASNHLSQKRLAS
ncbi:response regulator transcription factor [Microvirga sp. HBU67558]|uniref:LuxR C-terminal-related transcriptional regulator n=1 Tax=Microvirga TaxID=186650 RepID=UPI001B3774B9|nr:MULTISPECIES: response regulator transcription factor [unclassified Microvirga]MBQ0824673.1 response regulator transcription factor [Microvirga sp. HBU67558]